MLHQPTTGSLPLCRSLAAIMAGFQHWELEVPVLQINQVTWRYENRTMYYLGNLPLEGFLWPNTIFHVCFNWVNIWQCCNNQKHCGNHVCIIIAQWSCSATNSSQLYYIYSKDTILQSPFFLPSYLISDYCHTCTHTHTHTQAHTYIHTCTYTHIGTK